MLRWARANGCDWDADTCGHAALYGNLPLLQWLRANGCPWNYGTCYYAVDQGHVETLRWARENGCEWDAETRDWAARKFGTPITSATTGIRKTSRPPKKIRSSVTADMQKRTLSRPLAAAAPCSGAETPSSPPRPPSSETVLNGRVVKTGGSAPPPCLLPALTP